MNVRHTVLFPLLLLASGLTSQDPSPPPGGFRMVEALGQSAAWSDTWLYLRGVSAPCWPGVLAGNDGRFGKTQASVAIGHSRPTSQYQDHRPGPRPVPAQEKIVVRGNFPVGESPLLLLSAVRVAPLAIPGVHGALSLDPAQITVHPLQAANAGRFLELPATVATASTPLHAQVLSVSAHGMRLFPAFALAGSGIVPLERSAQRLRAIMVSRNRALGLTVITLNGHPLGDRQAARVEGWSPVQVGPVEALLPQMSGLTAVSNPEDYPYRVNGRIATEWPSGGGTDGSGVLIDARHVLTAGHMVFESAEGGWASNISFVPAYDHGTRPYGEARSESGHGWMHSWTGWTVDDDFSHDLALFELDRPVGALTGWHGYGYNTSCSFYKDTTFYIRCYPGSGPYDGESMHARSGTFSSCPNSHELRYLLENYFGESGSGFYYLNGDNRYVHGVQTHKVLGGGFGPKSDSTRLDEAKFDDVGDILRDAKPNSFDLTPLNVIIGSPPLMPIVAHGTRLPSLSFLVHNYSEADFNGQLTWSVRLSTNDFISTGDREIATGTLPSASIDSMNSLRAVHGTPPLIPADVASNFYWVGIILTTIDADSGNQITLADDVVKIFVQ